MVKVLFVCLGNICRSPLAEAIFNHKVHSQGLHGKFSCDSCGTSDYHIGELPDDRTIACAGRNNIPINHRARQINRVDIREFHYIIAMDHSNQRNINTLVSRYGKENQRVYLMREFHPESDHLEVPDPYYGGDESFDQVYQILDESIDHLMEHLKSEHNIYV